MKKKHFLAVAAIAALSAGTAVPAMALENEFHGMFKSFGYMSNAYNSTLALRLGSDNRTNSYMEQRARLQYIAKVSDDLKLVTHFEMDSRFGGITAANGTKYEGNGDGGQLDADSINLETKNVYLDFNIPVAKANVKIGVQPWADSYGSTFTAIDAAGVVVSKKFAAFTPSLGWFRLNDTTPGGVNSLSGKLTTDMVVADVKVPLTKDLTVGTSYYGVINNTVGAASTGSAAQPYELLHMVGINAAAKVGPAALTAFAAYQFGDYIEDNNSDISAFGLGATAKVKAGPGNINAAALYLSGDQNGAGVNNNQGGWQHLAPNSTYFAPANMWLLVRNGQTIGTSTALGGNSLNKGERGLMGFFGGYDVTMGKVFANANAGIAFTANGSAPEEEHLGTEINAQVGYKLYDNLSVSLVGAYLLLGDAINSSVATERIAGGVADADDPYLTAVQVSYVF